MGGLVDSDEWLGRALQVIHGDPPRMAALLEAYFSDPKKVYLPSHGADNWLAAAVRVLQQDPQRMQNLMKAHGFLTECPPFIEPIQVDELKSVEEQLEARVEELRAGVKDTNPKDAVGIKKAPFSTLSAPVMAEVGLAMLEGARKYGRYNWRVAGVRASVYYDACLRHMMAWWEGEDDDPDSGLTHIVKAIATLMVLRDAEIQGKLVDDRPPRSPPGWLARLNEVAAWIIDQYPDPKAPYIEGDQYEE